MNNLINLLMCLILLALTIAASVIEQASYEFVVLMILTTVTFFIHSIFELTNTKGE
jgi:hypothetical protein